MIIDSSAIVAIILKEADGPDLTAAIVSAKAPAMSAANWFEAAIVLDNLKNLYVRNRFDDLFQELGIKIVPLTVEQALIAREAHQKFGRGNHPARLNFGDCMAYALAKQTGEPLLFKGNDFAQTDLAAAQP